MAAAGGTTVPQGSMPNALRLSEEQREFEKILKISDEIFSGSHPRLKVPAQFVRKVSTRPLQLNSPVTQAQGPKQGTSVPSQDEISNHSPVKSAKKAIPHTVPLVNGPSNAAVAESTPSTRVVPKPTSEINPIFLTKSDDLVRAEIQLQRQRVERVLREQLEQRRMESRQRTAIQDTKPDFDVSEVLARALDLVKPVESETSDASDTRGPSDAPDDDSFYSSRAPDSPPRHDAQKQSPVSDRPLPFAQAHDIAAEAPADTTINELKRLEELNPSESDQDMPDIDSVADKNFPGQRALYGGPVGPVPVSLRRPERRMDIAEEPEYSPPAPEIPGVNAKQGEEYGVNFPDSVRRHEQHSRPAAVASRTRYSVSPDIGVRVVRNHITSPAAPRPSQLSSLANAKVPGVHERRDSCTEYITDRIHPEHDSDRTSPDIPAQQLMPRKRRRVQDRLVRSLQRRQGIDAPEPYIKEEPVSPPPFADEPSIVRSRGTADQPLYIDIESPRYTPAVRRREIPVQEPVYEYGHRGPVPEYRVSGETAVPRSFSRVSLRYPLRDEQDLRRVASLQYVRQPEYAPEYVEVGNSRTLRAVSSALVERPVQERPRYYEDQAPIQPRRVVSDVERLGPVSSHFEGAYFVRETPTRPAPPPQRRIVVDEHGNQYEMVPTFQTIRPSAPRGVLGDFPDQEFGTHSWGSRATSTFGEYARDPHERQYAQEMPPPTTAYRRVGGYVQPFPLERRSYATQLDESDPYLRGEGVQVIGYPKQVEYVEGPNPAREQPLRVQSVRPPTTRYVESRAAGQIMGHPPAAAREMSIYADDEIRRPRDYVAERPVYMNGRAGGGERYFENQRPESAALDGRQGPVRRVAQRH